MDDDPRLIARTVQEVPGVAGLHGGLFGEVASYLPGERVLGVRLNENGTVEVHVVLYLDAPLHPTAELIKQAIGSGRRVDVTIEDLVAREADENRAASS